MKVRVERLQRSAAASKCGRARGPAGQTVKVFLAPARNKNYVGLGLLFSATKLVIWSKLNMQIYQNCLTLAS